MRSRIGRGALIAVTLGLVSVAAVLVVDSLAPGFFRRDDGTNEFLPYLSEMGRLWTSGQLPILTSHSISGGNLLVDFERSAFHPLMILAALFATATHSASATALLVAALNLWATLVAGYVVAVTFGLAPVMRWFAAVTLATGPLFVFLYLASWYNAALGTSAFLWLLAALQWAATRTRRGPGPAIVVAAAVLNTLLIGWPHGYIAMLVLLLAYVIRISLSARAAGRTRWALASWPLIVAAGLALLVATPLLSEYLTLSHELARSGGIHNTDSGTPTLLQLLNVVNPSGGDFWTVWGGYGWWPIPIGLVSLGLVVLVFVRDARGLLSSPTVRLSLLLAAVFLLLSQLPSDLGPLRTQFRFVPYAGVFVTLAAADALSRARFRFNRRRIGIAMAGLTALVVIGSWRVPAPRADLREALIVPLLVLTVAAAGLVIVRRTERPRLGALVLGLAGVALLGIQAPTGLAPLHLPTSADPQTPANRAIVQRFPAGFILQATPGITYDNDVVPGYSTSRWLLAGQRVLNGYDPVGQVGYVARLAPISAQGHLALTAVDALAGPSELDPDRCDLQVWGVRTLVLVGDADGSRGREAAACGFRLLTSRGSDAVWIDRDDPMSGTASASSPGITIERDRELSDTHEAITVRNDTDRTGEVVFARIAWPGYAAVADDGRRLPIRQYEGALAAVEIPAGYRGPVTLSYFPASWRWALPLSGAALLGGVVLAVVATARTRRTVRAGAGRQAADVPR